MIHLPSKWLSSIAFYDPKRKIILDFGSSRACGCNHNKISIHAEQNAITDCAKRGVSCDGSDAYITHYPCVNCMKLLCASGIKNIYYINDYRNDDIVNYFLNQSTMEKIEKI